MTTEKSSLDMETATLRKMVADQPLQLGGINDNSQKQLTLHLWDAVDALNRTTSKLNKILIGLTVVLVLISAAQVWITWVSISQQH